MKPEEKLFDAITQVEDDLVEEALRHPARRRFPWRRWGALAACLALAAGLAWAARLLPAPADGDGLSQPGETAGNEAGGAAEDGGEGNASSGDIGAAFLSYAGPVLPLTIEEEGEGLSASRELRFDLSPYQSGERKALVTDQYTLENGRDTEQSVTLLYPFSASLHSSRSLLPGLSADGRSLQAELLAGGTAAPAGDPSLNSWDDYQHLLAAAGLPESPKPSPMEEEPVTVYQLTRYRWSGEGEAPALQFSFPLEEERTAVLTYGFDGSVWGREDGTAAVDFFLPPPGDPANGEPRYVILLGEDIGSYQIQGYQDGSCTPGQELEAEAQVIRRETTLGEILDQIIARYRAGAAQAEEEPTLASLLSRSDCLRLLLQQLFPTGSWQGGQEALGDGWLESALQRMEGTRRVFYLRAEAGIPAGGSLTVEAVMEKERSFGFGGFETGRAEEGYDFAASLGSRLFFTKQSVFVENPAGLPFAGENLGLRPAGDAYAAVLPEGQEHGYFLLVPES